MSLLELGLMSLLMSLLSHPHMLLRKGPRLLPTTGSPRTTAHAWQRMLDMSSSGKTSLFSIVPRLQLSIVDVRCSRDNYGERLQHNDNPLTWSPLQVLYL